MRSLGGTPLRRDSARHLVRSPRRSLRGAEHAFFGIAPVRAEVDPRTMVPSERAFLVKAVALAFGSFVSIGLALFSLDDVARTGYAALIENGRVALVVIGAIGLLATSAFHIRLPGSRLGLLIAYATGALVILGYLAAVLFVTVQAPVEEFRRGKVPTVTVGALLTVVVVLALGWGMRAIYRDRAPRI